MSKKITSLKHKNEEFGIQNVDNKLKWLDKRNLVRIIDMEG